MEDKTIYYISEAAKKVQVESHVLRYWEDELKLPIKRNEMGHRYYTDQDIRQLQQIKLLKEQGLQLKAIRTVLFKIPPVSGENTERQVVSGASESAEQSREQAEGATADREKSAGDADSAVMYNKPETGRDKLMEMVQESMKGKKEEGIAHRTSRYVVALSGDESGAVEQKPEYDDTERNRKAARLQYLLQHMITEAVKSANRELCTDVKETILKELDYQFRMQEERDDERWKKEEEHYRRIDEMIRDRHKPREKLGKNKKKV